MEQEILDILYITTHQYLLSHYGIFSSYDTYTSLLATNASNEVIEGINFGTVTVTQGVGSVFFFVTFHAVTVTFHPYGLYPYL